MFKVIFTKKSFLFNLKHFFYLDSSSLGIEIEVINSCDLDLGQHATKVKSCTIISFGTWLLTKYNSTTSYEGNSFHSHNKMRFKSPLLYNKILFLAYKFVFMFLEKIFYNISTNNAAFCAIQ